MKQFVLIYSAAIAICAVCPHSRAQNSDIGITVQYNNSQSVNVTGSSEPVGVTPNSVVHVTVSLPETLAGQTVKVLPLDGGRVVSQNSSVAADGTFSLVFQAPSNFGLNRVELRHGSHKLGLQFWVLDPANPQNNPPVITPGHPQE